MRGKQICPKCGCEYDEVPALSRVDNTTYICSECGTIEALEDVIRYKEQRQGGEQK